MKKGTRYSPMLCPIARAIREQLKAKRTQRILVTVVDIVLFNTETGERLVAKAPNSVKRFVTKFDEKKPVKPFTFRLAI